MSSKQKMIFKLIIPIVVLLVLTFYKTSIRTTGAEVKFPITGYDPRDLLAGNYLIYTVDYGISQTCQYREKKSWDLYLCVDNKYFAEEVPSECKIFIKGRCENSRFLAGIERFYVPREKAQDLERLVRDKKAEILVSVNSQGEAVVKDLLIDSKSWKDQYSDANESK